MMQGCPRQQGMFDMTLMINPVTGVLAIARRLLSVSKPVSTQQHLLTSGTTVHPWGLRAKPPQRHWQRQKVLPLPDTEAGRLSV